MKPRPLTLILLLAALAAPAAAQFTPQATASPGSAPQGINYQGRLEDNGFPATGSKQMVFRVFDVATGGTALWTSPAQAVDVQIGLFNAVVPVPLTALVGGGSRYLEVQIDGTVMAPRELLNSVPYALIAKSVEGTIDVSTAGLSVVANSAATTPSLHISSQSGTVGVGTAAVSGLFVVGAGTLVVNADGYVGLGLSAPQARLGIRDSNAATTVGSKAFLEFYNSDFTAGNTYGIHFRQFDAVGGFQTVGVIDAVGISHAAGAQSGALAFGTRNAGAFSEKMRIDAGGNVGIGTTPSATRLQVTGSGLVGDGIKVVNAGDARLTISTGSIGGTDWSWANNWGNFGGFSLIEETVSGSRIFFQPGGNVGIGTTSPGAKLDVAGHQLFSVAGASITFNAGGPTIGVPTGNTLAFGTSGIERARIDNLGNIGIGTTNPLDALQFADVVAGSDIRIGRRAAVAHAPGNVPSSLRLTVSDGSVAGIYIMNERNLANTFNDQHIRFDTHEGGASAGERMRIAPNGNVGVGTPSPQAPLHVVGIASVTASITVGGITNASVPRGMVSFFNLAACPTGWSELVTGRGRYLVGLPAAGTLAGTAGTALSNLENRPVGQHNHGVTDPGHTHGGAPNLGSASGATNSLFATGIARAANTVDGLTSGSNTTGLTVNNAGTVAGTNAPYIQLLICQKD